MTPELRAAISTFKRHLHLDDCDSVFATAAVLAANRAPGDPVWLLTVAAPASGKTEVVQSAAELPNVIAAATITEAALLSGTAKRDRAKDATGGLLRQVGPLGTLLCKDFTSVLSQNRDAARQALAALREVHDGSWHRPVGTDGGRVLTWEGKCGLLGCVTPTIDRHHAVLGTLGDRFLLLRSQGQDRDAIARKALGGAGSEAAMRADLGEAMHLLVESAQLDVASRELTEDEVLWLVGLATFTSQARTAVERDGYSHEVVVLPELEGPGRLVKQLRGLHGGLEAIGCDPADCRRVVDRVAADCVPAIRTAVMRVLIASGGPTRTATVAEAIGVVTKTAELHLEDLALLAIADRSKTSSASNAANLWAATPWLTDHQEKVRERCTTTRVEVVEESLSGEIDSSPYLTSLSSSEPPEAGPQPASQPVGADDGRVGLDDDGFWASFAAGGRPA